MKNSNNFIENFEMIEVKKNDYNYRHEYISFPFEKENEIKDLIKNKIEYIESMEIFVASTLNSILDRALKGISESIIDDFSRSTNDLYLCLCIAYELPNLEFLTNKCHNYFDIVRELMLNISKTSIYAQLHNIKKYYHDFNYVTNFFLTVANDLQIIETYGNIDFTNNHTFNFDKKLVNLYIDIININLALKYIDFIKSSVNEVNTSEKDFKDDLINSIEAKYNYKAKYLNDSYYVYSRNFILRITYIALKGLGLTTTYDEFLIIVRNSSGNLNFQIIAGSKEKFNIYYIGRIFQILLEKNLLLLNKSKIKANNPKNNEVRSLRYFIKQATDSKSSNEVISSKHSSFREWYQRINRIHFFRKSLIV